MSNREIAKRAMLAVMAALIISAIIFNNKKINDINSGCYINNTGYRIFVTNDMIYLSNIISQKISFSRDKKGIFFTLKTNGISVNNAENSREKLEFSQTSRFKHYFSENRRRINIIENQGNDIVFSLVNSPEDVDACMEWGIR